MTRAITFSIWIVVLFAPRVIVADEPVQFNRDVRPILANHCFSCHGFDEKTRESGLRLDLRKGATAELESGSGYAIVPGKPDESVLVQRLVTHDMDEKMPPLDSGKQLTSAQIDLLETWIAQGAEYERHWSFVPPKSESTPIVQHSQWPRNAIDVFILSRLEKEGLSPSPEADRRTLIRRVALDVTGLPPTLDEIRRFINDDSDAAFENMVDRYLESPRYGEHMARFWLDQARYADTSGYQYDRERTMWVWRDWVIHAYNSNMPFDEFTVEQLAGDLIPNAQPQQILATGFNRNHPITIEGGVIDEEYRTEYVIDRLTTTATVWMGLTVGCARCHDHKFDPISQKEFYRLSDFFNQVDERGLNGFDPKQQIASPLADAPNAKTVNKLANLKAKLESLRRPPGSHELEAWVSEIADSDAGGWHLLEPVEMKSSGGSELQKQTDFSIIAGGANPQKDVYELTAVTQQVSITAVRLECLMDASLPGGGPGRHSNSNFVLSEFELVAHSVQNSEESKSVKFSRAKADYSQSNYEIRKAIDGIVKGSNGWAVDGPTRKKPATAIFFAERPFGFAGGTELKFRLRHEAEFKTHGIGRPRLSITTDETDTLDYAGIPADVRIMATKKLSERTAAETTRLQEMYQVARTKAAESIQSQIDLLTAEKTYPPTLVMRDRTNPRKTHVLDLGQYDRPGEVVSAGVPDSLFPMDNAAPANRLGFAQWLVDPQHPLTARVAVNRYWQQLFGTGLVKTAEDFGTQGEWPSHLALLDALAIDFVKNDWDVKRMLRQMLTSATYRQSSGQTREIRERDPENRLLSRGPRFRLDAEQIRDQALAVSGLLEEKIGGPSVYPYQPKGLWLELNNRPGYSREYKPGTGESLYRRSMYTFWKRTVLSPMLKTFDAPGREFCTVRRSRTNTPLQALLLLQGPQYVEAARQLAARMMRQGGTDVESRINYGFELATSRLPDKNEIRILTDLFADRLEAFRLDPEAAAKALAVGDRPRDTRLDAVEHAAWMEVARLILNLDEVITKG